MMTDRWIWTAVLVLFGAMLVLSLAGCDTATTLWKLSHCPSSQAGLCG
jgi:hypothetical protein